MRVAESASDLERTLRERFGLERFRPGQREVIEQVLRGRDVLCVMPTGGGKSLCYQLPALCLDGLTLVVSPLIALMKDQVDALCQRGIRATLINSTLDPSEQHVRLIEIEERRFDLVYVAPERFRSPRFVEAMARIKPALLAVDEAHCISEWGHDFRPDYARLGQARRALGMPSCNALTATATDLVRRDIADQLDLHEPAQFVTGFDRPNLTYGVIEARRDSDKQVALASVLERNPGSSIVYVSSRKRCEDVGRFLEHDLRRSTVIYHAGLPREERSQAQDRFMAGEAEIVVATNAFGMGVDKPDIRSVIHFNMPGTLEAYYQEAGRAGRDGLPAECVLLYAPGDRFLQELFIENEYPPREAVFRVYNYLRGLDADPIELTQAEIKEATGLELNESAVGTALKLLEGAGALERLRPRENMAIIRINAEPDEPSLVDRLGTQAHVQRLVLIGLEGLVNRRFGEPVYFHPDELASALGIDRQALVRAIRNLTSELPIDYIPPFRGNAVRIIDRERRSRDVPIDFASLNTRKQQEYEKLERMIQYAQTSRCRRAYLLGYFGETRETHCGRCDHCGTDAQAAEPISTRPIDTPAGREVLLKILSGVARTKGRFGKTAIAQMLVGSSSERMARGGLTALSTFGILAHGGFTQKEVADILDALTSIGLVESRDVDRFKPVLQLSEPGWAWLRRQDDEAPRLPLPEYLVDKIRNGGLERVAMGRDSGTAAPPPRLPVDGPEVVSSEEHDETSSFSNVGDPLWERLRNLRNHWARESNVPAYCIFRNQTLEAIVRERPRTPSDLLRIKGMSPAKLERFGEALLTAIREAPDLLHPSTEDVPGSREDATRPSSTVRAESLEVAEGDGTLGVERIEEAAPDATGPEPKVPPRPAPISKAGYVPTEEWTWRLLDRGFSLDEAAAIRGLELEAIVRHATWMARQGKPVPLSAFLTPEVIERWEAWHLEHGNARPPEELGGAFALWGLYLACRTGQERTA